MSSPPSLDEAQQGFFYLLPECSLGVPLREQCAHPAGRYTAWAIVGKQRSLRPSRLPVARLFSGLPQRGAVWPGGNEQQFSREESVPSSKFSMAVDSGSLLR
ncbi:hypothetical protein ElyMa_002875900 [Elysia marginata]|uniref:Uncharacterized protein n=1 Tax=Elysia marginata TaxID=1093978 RepID=A0AAV4I1N3_9GAST|nr:hypothetical protein ElyMa_002875900 [Elysia marginata]